MPADLLLLPLHHDGSGCSGRGGGGARTSRHGRRTSSRSRWDCTRACTRGTTPPPSSATRCVHLPHHSVGLSPPLHVVTRFVTTPKHLTSCPIATQEDVPKLMKAITTAIGRHKTASGATTLVIISTAGRGEYNTQHSLKMSECTWRFARILTHEAHKAGEQGRHSHHHLPTSPVAHILLPIALIPHCGRVPCPRARRNRASVAVPVRALHARAQHEARVAPRKPRVQHRRHVLARAHLVPAEERDVAVAPGERVGRVLAPVSPSLPVRVSHAASWVLQAGGRTRLLAA